MVQSVMVPSLRLHYMKSCRFIRFDLFFFSRCVGLNLISIHSDQLNVKNKADFDTLEQKSPWNQYSKSHESFMSPFHTRSYKNRVSNQINELFRSLLSVVEYFVIHIEMCGFFLLFYEPFLFNAHMSGFNGYTTSTRIAFFYRAIRCNVIS